MKKFVISISVISICAIVGAIAFAELPAPDPDAFWKYITKESPYTEWSFWPDHQGMQPGRAPHGPLHKVFVNDRGINSTKPPVQYGTIAVKENYSKSKELKGKPTMIIANNVPGKGVSFIENDYEWHGKPPTPEQGKIALAELEQLRETITRGKD